MRASRKRYERLRTTRVWINGEEVTTNCFYADPRRGVVRLYLRDGDGKRFVDRSTGEVAKEERRGRVKVRVGR